jgi:hypothetical protein
MSAARARLDRCCAPPLVLFALDGTLSRLDGGLVVVWLLSPSTGRAAGAVNGAVDSAAAEQRRVVRVDDRVHGLLRDVTLRERHGRP